MRSLSSGSLCWTVTVPILFIVLLVLAWPDLFWAHRIPVNGQTLRLYFPDWTLLRSIAHEPDLFLWDPYRSLGRPFWADPLSMLTYPVTWILFFIHDFGHFLEVWILIHTALAAGFAFGLGYSIWRSLPVSLACAVLAGWNGFFVGHGCYINQVAAAAYVPALLYFSYRRHPGALTICLALQWFAGYPPFFLLSVIALFFMRFCGIGLTLKNLMAALGIAVLMTGIQSLPFVEMIVHSTRGVWVPPSIATEFSIPPVQLLKCLLMPQWIRFSPSLAGDASMVCFYVGLPVVAAAAWGCWNGNGRVRILGIATLLTLALSLGRFLPGYESMPFLHVSRYPAHWLLLSTLGISCLGLIGLARMPTTVQWAGMAVITIDLVSFAHEPRIAWFDKEFLDRQPPLVSILRNDSHPGRLWMPDILDESAAFMRLETVDDFVFFRNTLIPSFSTAFAIPEASSYDILAPSAGAAQMAKAFQEGLSSQRLRWAGVTHVLTRRDGTHPFSPQNIQLIRFPDHAYPAFLVPNNENASVRVIRRTPATLDVSVDNPFASTLVFSENAYPGWRARVDGQRVTIKRFEDAFMAVTLPPGLHRVSWTYRPWSLLIGLLCSVFGFYGLKKTFLSAPSDKEGNFSQP